MPKAAGGPSTEQLLELLKRAAAELTTAREETARVQKELGKEKKLRDDAEARLTSERTVGGVKPKMREQMEELQETYQTLKQQSEQARLELQQSRENLVNEVAAQREMKSALERENQSHSQTRAALEAEQNAHLQTRAELDAARATAEEGANEQLLQARAAQEQAEAALGQARGELAGEHQRVADLTESLATALAEKEGGIARIDSLEAARKTDREIEDAKVKELEDKAAMDVAREQQSVLEAQSALAQEKEKHQATAQKFLTEKQKARELESALQEAKARVAELESATVAAADAHAKELHEREASFKSLEENLTKEQQRITAAHAAEVASLQAALTPLQQQVETTSQERFYVERKYEELSRELQMTLEQRDEARRILENVQAERQRLERALQQR
jgi:chromosome segregation ATPase